MKLIFATLVLMVLCCSCHKNSVCTEGTVKDFTGLDGCGKMIVLNDGTVLEPVSLPPGTTLVPGGKACIVYKEKPAISICMAGETVEIISLTYE